jgi:NAD(P)-dependent dehydrogenase (short-subunit alcohol dehydrogenase family)
MLKDKVVLVTGSTAGIGKGIAMRAASEGAAVVVSGRRAEAGQAVADTINEAGGESMFVQLDVTMPEMIESAVQTTVDRYGRLDGLVNNVANMELGAQDRPVTELDLETWNLIIASDLTSAFLGMKHGIRAMLDGGRGGSVVNIASESGIRGVNGCEGYTASKGGMVSMTRSVASYYARYDIRCNALAVGAVDTGEGRVAQTLRTNEVFAREIHRHHLGRIGSPAEIAGIASFLLSDDAIYISGTVIPVDGGSSAASHIARPQSPDLSEHPRKRPMAPEF